METAGVEPATGASGLLCRLSFVPGSWEAMRTDGVEPSQREAPRLQRGELSGCSASANGRATDRIRTGTARITTSDAAVTPRSPRSSRNGDGRARTGDLSPDKRALCAAELRPLARVKEDAMPSCTAPSCSR
jgi:hypothetical protein